MPKKLSRFEPVFSRLRDLLKKQAAGLAIDRDTADYYGLHAPTGPATVKVWGGKMNSPMIPVAWVQVGKAYVSFHLMGVYGNPKLLDDVSESLLARMHGKSCFNFKAVDEKLFVELEKLTARSIQGMKQAGFVADGPSG
jgi:hypothetical protein